MGLFSKFTSKKSNGSSEAEPVEYNGYQITIAPAKVAGGFRVGAKVTRERNGEALIHDMVRSDVISSKDEADRISLIKAKLMIDQLGEDMFQPKN